MVLPAFMSSHHCPAIIKAKKLKKYIKSSILVWQFIILRFTKKKYFKSMVRMIMSSRCRSVWLSSLQWGVTVLKLRVNVNVWCSCVFSCLSSGLETWWRWSGGTTCGSTRVSPSSWSIFPSTSLTQNSTWWDLKAYFDLSDPRTCRSVQISLHYCLMLKLEIIY